MNHGPIGLQPIALPLSYTSADTSVDTVYKLELSTSVLTKRNRRAQMAPRGSSSRGRDGKAQIKPRTYQEFCEGVRTEGER